MTRDKLLTHLVGSRHWPRLTDDLCKYTFEGWDTVVENGQVSFIKGGEVIKHEHWYFARLTLLSM